MNYKQRYKILPIDIIKYIGAFDNTSKERMNNVIQELNEYNDKIEEYWREDEQAYYMSDWQISCRQKWDPEFGNRGFPVLSLLWGDFILSGDIFHLDRRE